MIKRRCIFGMYGLKDSDFIVRVREIQINLSNPGFSAVIPTPTTINSMLDQLAIWVAEALMKDYRNSAARIALRKELNRLVSQQVISVNSIAQGDVNILVLTGFDLNKVPSSIPVPEQGEVDRVVNRENGTVEIYNKRLLDCLLYEAEITGPNNFYLKESSFYPKIKIANLPMGVNLFVITRGRNKKGNGLWSGPLSFVANISPQGGPVTP